MESKKRRLLSVSNDEEDDQESHQLKEESNDEIESKQEPETIGQDVIKEQISKDGEYKIDLGKNKKVTVRSFKKTKLVDIREFYVKHDAKLDKEVELPGKKGISLTVEVWQQLLDHVDEINQALKLLHE